MDPKVTWAQLENKVQMDLRVKLVQVVTEEKPDPKDQLELLDQLDQPEKQEQLDQWETQERLDFEDKPVYLELQVHPEMLVPMVHLELQPPMEQMVQLVPKDLSVHQDYQEHQESVVFQDILDDPDVTESQENKVLLENQDWMAK